MGLKGYFKSKKGQEEKQQPQTQEQAIDEKTALPPPSFAPSPRYGSSRNSLTPSVRSSTFAEDIKHEVMVNYLYQQQCANMWVADGTGELEGVLLRKWRGNYMACPPALATSAFAQACAALNVQVGIAMSFMICTS